MQTDSADIWREQDFTDEPTPSFNEEDPWDPLRILDRSPPLKKPTPPNAAAIAGQMPPAPDDRKDNEQPHSVGAQDTPSLDRVEEPHSDEDDFPDYQFEDEPRVGLDEEPFEEPVPTDEFDYGLYDESYQREEEPLEEPIPTTDPDSGLSSKLYPEPESIVLTDIDIRFDKFLASIGLSEVQDEQIRDRLKDFSKARLSNWLNWFASKIWTGQTLLLFIQFYDYWEINSEWWESGWYHQKYGWQIGQSNILSRDDAYYIVHCRVEFPPYEVIDPLWFKEWNRDSLWRYGFLSFASFAKFRAALDDDEEWKYMVELESVEDGMAADYWSDQSIRIGIPIGDSATSLCFHTTSVAHWYDIQDWYPKHEWHDNLI